MLHQKKRFQLKNESTGNRPAKSEKKKILEESEVKNVISEVSESQKKRYPGYQSGRKVISGVSKQQKSDTRSRLRKRVQGHPDFCSYKGVSCKPYYFEVGMSRHGVNFKVILGSTEVNHRIQ